MGSISIRAIIFHCSSFRLMVFPLCPRRKIHKGRKFVSSVFVVMDFIITHTDGPSNVCVSFSRWKAETRWRWVSSCVPFLSALVALPSFSPPPTPLPRQAAWIYIYTPTDRPTDRQRFILKRAKEMLDKIESTRWWIAGFFFFIQEKESS